VNILTPLIFLIPGIDWIITKVILRGGDNNDGSVGIRVCLPRLDPIPLNKGELTRDEIYKPVEKLLLYITGLLQSQVDLSKNT
jgi:hypothetical protein